MSDFEFDRLSRRAVLALGAGAAAALCALPAFAAVDTAAAQKIADHFSSVKTMMGDFVQFGPRGEQTGGKFYIERPGKIRFAYESPAAFMVVSDGKSVMVDNERMKTVDLYPLSQTPLKLLLDERIDVSGNQVQKVDQAPDQTTIHLADKNMFGNARIAMMFDPQSYELKQWTITDAQGKETTVMIFNVKNGVTFDDAVFAIDYRKVNVARERNSSQR
jgi:outer membrane lipoprotein-sorting protein